MIYTKILVFFNYRNNSMWNPTVLIYRHSQYLLTSKFWIISVSGQWIRFLKNIGKLYWFKSLEHHYNTSALLLPNRFTDNQQSLIFENGYQHWKCHCFVFYRFNYAKKSDCGSPFLPTYRHLKSRFPRLSSFVTNVYKLYFY